MAKFLLFPHCLRAAYLGDYSPRDPVKDIAGPEADGARLPRWFLLFQLALLPFFYKMALSLGLIQSLSQSSDGFSPFESRGGTWPGLHPAA